MSESSPPADRAEQPPEAPAPKNVHLIELPGKRIHLIGTAHISSQSVEEVRRVIAEVKPASVCVELCESRYQSLTRPEAWREMNVVQVVRQKRATMLLVHLILAAFQRRLGEEVSKLAPEVDVVLLGQFSMASALEYLRGVSPVPVLSAPHSSARRLKELLAPAG